MSAHIKNVYKDDFDIYIQSFQFGVSACQFNAPIVLSWPHFMGANSSFVNAIEGLNPNPADHEFYFDVQPTTGTTLAAKARLQVNIAIKRTDTFQAVSKVRKLCL